MSGQSGLNSETDSVKKKMTILVKITVQILCFEDLVYFMCMNALLAFMCMHHVHAWCSQKSEEDTGCPGTRVPVVTSHSVGAGN